MTHPNGTRLTDEQIDKLSERELDEAVAIACGWTWQRLPHGFRRVICDRTMVGSVGLADGTENVCDDWDTHLRWWHSDLGAAMELLLSLDTTECGWSIDCCTTDSGGEVFEVYSELLGPPLASGPKSDATALCCRAFLKLKNRE